MTILNDVGFLMIGLGLGIYATQTMSPQVSVPCVEPVALAGFTSPRGWVAQSPKNEDCFAVGIDGEGKLIYDCRAAEK